MWENIYVKSFMFGPSQSSDPLTRPTDKRLHKCWLFTEMMHNYTLYLGCNYYFMRGRPYITMDFLFCQRILNWQKCCHILKNNDVESHDFRHHFFTKYASIFVNLFVDEIKHLSINGKANFFGIFWSFCCVQEGGAEGSGTLSIPKCPWEICIFGKWNNCPHPYTTLTYD